MSTSTKLLLVVACAALLQNGSEARNRNLENELPRPNRRNREDASISLGTIKGSNIITLPVIHLSGPDVIVGFPDNCVRRGLELLGTEMIVSNLDVGPRVTLLADDANDPESHVAVHCKWEFRHHRCPRGVGVASYQYCGGPLAPSSTEAPVPTQPSTDPASPPPTFIPSSSSSEEV